MRRSVVGSPSQDYTHPDDQTKLLHVTPGFKPFTVEYGFISPKESDQRICLRFADKQFFSQNFSFFVILTVFCVFKASTMAQL